MLPRLLAIISLALTGPLFSAEAVLVQSASQIANDLRSSTPTVAVQEAARITSELNAYSRTSNPADGRILSKEEEIERLKALPPNRMPFKQASLAAVIRLLADDAKMNYIAPPDAEFSEKVQANISMNAYEFLQVLGENFGFGMEYDTKGVWRFYKINLNELLTKAYTIRFNTGDRVSINSYSINNQLMGNSGNSSMSGGAKGPVSDGGSRGSFDIKAGKIIEDIKKIVMMPTVSTHTPSLEAGSQPGRAGARKGEAAPQVEPIWNPDTSQLFVVGTRQQHSLIEAYLKTLDQPQELIKISAKFVETSRNPQRDFGVDWSKSMLGRGGPVTLGGSGSSGGNNGTGGTPAASSTAPLSTNVDLNHIGQTKLPQAILSAPAFQVTMQAFASDRMSSVLQDPTLLTTNNRVVTFKATTQQPVQQSSTNIGSSSTTSTAQIVYLEIGTVITVLPIIRPGNARGGEDIDLNISIVVSSIVGEKIVGGNPYPITSSRTYEYQVTVPNGYTLAIAGLEERSRDTSDGKVPIFGDIPVIGFAFKSRMETMTKTTLLAFITPEIVRTRAPEGPADSLSLPQPTRQIFDGTKDENLTQIDQSLSGIPADVAALERVANPVNRDLVLNRLERIGVELGLMEVRLGEIRMAKSENTEAQAAKLGQFRALLAAARSAVEKITPSR